MLYEIGTDVWALKFMFVSYRFVAYFILKHIASKGFGKK